MTIYLIQCGQTEWRAEGRLQGRLSLPLSQLGVEEATALAGQLADIQLAAIYTATCEACVQTARLISGQSPTRPRVHQLADLAELDLGLWQGMLAEDIKRRQPRVYRQWQEDPEHVTPPGGESVGQAWQRVVKAVERLVRRGEPSQAAAVVVAPIAAAILRCYLGGRPIGELWTMSRRTTGEPERFAVAVSGS